MNDGLVPGRQCGGCTVCCTALTIDQPELQKLPGYPCPQCHVGGGCTIYDTRPRICREWFCAWRQLDWMGETLRPDRSGVLVIPTTEDIPPEHDPRFGLVFVMLSQAGLKADGLPEALARSIGGNIATYLSVPRDPGQQSVRMPLNDDLQDSVARGNAGAVRRDLKKLYLGLKFFGEADPDQPAVIRHGSSAEGTH